MERGEAERYDLVVIGAGAAGSTVAFEAVGRGARVAMIERWKVGGTCLNAGCDPTKTLVRAAEVVYLARQAAMHGIDIPEVRVDWPAVVRRVEGVIDRIRGGDGDRNVRAAGIDLYKGHARFRSSHEIDIDGADAASVIADKVLVATGATNRPLPIPGLREAGYLTNEEAVRLPTLPASLAIIGGGVVGVEFAQMFARFGVDVTIFAARDRILPREDEDLTDLLQETLRAEGIRIETGLRAGSVSVVDGRRRVVGEREGEQVEAMVDQILLAAGRTPMVEGLNLQAAGVRVRPEGIVVDDTLQTTAPNIWAAGDVIGGDPFTHVADYHARIVEHNALSGLPPRRVDQRVVPWVTFTDPELGRVGLTEREARKAGYDVKCATVQMSDMARAITSAETDGLVKLVSDRQTGEILGGHVLAARGGELLPQIALAMRLRLPVSTIAETIHAYPTLSEAVFWAAFELAKPHDPALDSVRGVQAPMVVDDEA